MPEPSASLGSDGLQGKTPFSGETQVTRLPQRATGRSRLRAAPRDQVTDATLLTCKSTISSIFETFLPKPASCMYK